MLSDQEWDNTARMNSHTVRVGTMHAVVPVVDPVVVDHMGLGTYPSIHLSCFSPPLSFIEFRLNNYLKNTENVSSV
jgi:hypothetical protein